MAWERRMILGPGHRLPVVADVDVVVVGGGAAGVAAAETTARHGSSVLLIERYTKRCCLANDVICSMLGYRHDEFAELTVEDIQPGLGDEDVVDQLCDPLLGQHSLMQDVPLKRKDGSILYVDMSSFPIVVGDRDYLLDIFKDVTERHRAQHQQLQLMDRLGAVNVELGVFVKVLAHNTKTSLPE